MNYEREHQRHEDLNWESLLKGDYINPFTDVELNLLCRLRDGFNGMNSNAASIGMTTSYLHKVKADISEKISEIYTGLGKDNLAKALSISILAGWIDDGELKKIDVPLDKDELKIIFNRSFGFTPYQLRKKLNFSEQKFNDAILDIRRKFSFNSDYQVVAWGAAKAKRWLEENPGAQILFIPS